MDFIYNNLANIIISIIIIALVILIIIKIVKDKKSGKTFCSYGCSDCPYNNNCTKKESNNE